MSSIIIPCKWQKQPQYPVEIDRASSIGKDVIHSWYPNGLPLTPTGAYAWSAGVDGRKLDFTSNATNYLRIITGNGAGGIITPEQLPSSNVTILIGYQKADSTNRVSSAFGVDGNTGDRCGVHLPYSDGTVYFDFGGTSAGTSRLSVAGLNHVGYHQWAFSSGPAGMAIYQDGVKRASQSGSASRTAFATYLNVGYNAMAASDIAGVYYFHILKRQLSDAEAVEVTRNPWQIFRKRAQILYFDVGGGGGITGTLAATESGSDSAALTGDVLIDGALAAIESGSDSASIAGDVLIDGALAATETGSDTAAFTGDASNAIIGTLAATETGSDSAAIAGDVFVEGALAVNESGSDIAAITGDVLVQGALAATEAGNDAAAFVGSAAGPIIGTLDATETGEDVASFRGPITVTGGGIGHGGFARKAKRLVRIEEAESPEEVIAEIERQFAETPKKVGRKPKTVTNAQKPLETPEVAPNQWLDYYKSQANALREQEAMNDLLAQAKLKLQALQEQETLKRLEEYQAMLQVQEEEELLFLLMAA